MHGYHLSLQPDMCLCNCAILRVTQTGAFSPSCSLVLGTILVEFKMHIITKTALLLHYKIVVVHMQKRLRAIAGVGFRYVGECMRFLHVETF